MKLDTDPNELELVFVTIIFSGLWFAICYIAAIVGEVI